MDVSTFPSILARRTSLSKYGEREATPEYTIGPTQQFRVTGNLRAKWIPANQASFVNPRLFLLGSGARFR
jgi:hypothetical protein